MSTQESNKVIIKIKIFLSPEGFVVQDVNGIFLRQGHTLRDAINYIQMYYKDLAKMYEDHNGHPIEFVLEIVE